MKNTIIYFVVGLLLISSFAAISIGQKASEQQKIMSINFLEPKVIAGETFVELEIEGTNSYIFNPGEPNLPIHVESLTLPFGTTITDIKCDVQEIETMVLSEKIMPAPQQIPKNQIEISYEPILDEAIYNSDDVFPNDWFSYDVGVGLDKNMEHKTILTINSYPVRYNALTNTIYYVKNIDLTIKFNEPTTNPFPTLTEYNMVIIAPLKFSRDLQKLIDHKNNLNPPVKTVFVSTEWIYKNYTAYDKPEKIKYFIKDAIETWNVTYVLLVGGLKSLVYGQPKDNTNEGTRDWYVPVRYSNLKTNEPGYLCDLYYADVYKTGGVFDNWDSNGNHIYAEFFKDKLDLYPDVCLGRLSCRNNWEVRSIVDKIINYEDGPADTSWFNDMVVISGDGFLDQEDLDIQWNTNGLPTGVYTIYAWSTNPDMTSGPIEMINVTVDKTKPTLLTFNHDDYLRIPNFPKYPAGPMAEIVSVTEGNILGYNDSSYTPSEAEAYCNNNLHWANLLYDNGILHIRGKTYDPEPYGNVSTIHVEIKNSDGITVFTDNRTTEMYWEGEWTTGEIPLFDRAGAPYYMPPEFETEFLWTSNGKFASETDVKNAFDKGNGFMFFSGHGSPYVWADHYPGIPGNRRHGSITGLRTVNTKPVYYPMNKLTNDYKNPVVVVGGCHNSMFNVSLIVTYFDKHNLGNTHCYGIPTPECWSEMLVSLPKRGAIACMGNTGYGFGILGKQCTIGGVDNWITTEFFKQYGTVGLDILGQAYSQAITSYIKEFGKGDDGHVQTVQEWVLHGDPSLKMGGYPSLEQEVTILVNKNGASVDGTQGSPVVLQASNNGRGTPISYQWSIDKDDDGVFTDKDSYPTGETISETWDRSGVFWVQLETTYQDGHTEVTNTVVEIRTEELPEQPTKPTGASNIKAGIPYTYSTTTTDPNNYDIYYLFEWGDESYSVAGPASSGKTVSSTHIWSKKGSYEVKVMAIDEMAYWTEWSEPLTVSATKVKSQEIFNQPLIQYLSKFLENHPNLFPVLRQLLEL